jgi:DNA-binding PadR family transcriptional regulator
MRPNRPAEAALRKVTERGDVFEGRDFILQRGVGRVVLQRYLDAGWIFAEPVPPKERQTYRLTEAGRTGLAGLR